MFVGNKQKTVIGIDNGTTGTISVFVGNKLVEFMLTPHYVQQSYTKEINNVSRIDFTELLDLFSKYNKNCFAVLERPLSNPERYNQSMIALRAFEATIIALGLSSIDYLVIDSKRWQRRYLKGFGGEALKRECTKLGIEEYPQYEKLITDHGDADGIYIGKCVIDGIIKFGEKQKVKKPKQEIRKFDSNV